MLSVYKAKANPLARSLCAAAIESMIRNTLVF